MSVSVSAVKNRAILILQDAENDRWTSDELTDWLLEGALKLVELKPDAKLETFDMPLVQGVEQQLANAYVALVRVVSNTNGVAVTQCDRAPLDTFSPSWMIRPTSSSVKQWIPHANPRKFYVYPAQGANPGSVTVQASGVPTINNDTLDVREIYAERLVHYVLYRAFSKDAEFAGAAERAVAHYQAFSA